MPQSNFTTDFCIEYSGESHELDVNVLLTSLLNFSTAIQEIKDEVSPDSKIEIKVKPFGEGSFLLLLGLYAPEIIKKAMSLFQRDDISLVANIISIFGTSLKVKEFLRGKSPKEVGNEDRNGKIQITNQNGDITQFNAEVINIYLGNPKIDKVISKAFEAIKSEGNVTGVKVKDSKHNVISDVPFESFDYMAKDLELEEPKSKIVKKEGVSVQATKLSFEKGYVWGFVYDGNRINAKIKDESFYSRIDNNERFSKGDIFIVNMDIIQSYEEDINAYLNKAYEITAVIEHREPPKQTTLFNS